MSNDKQSKNGNLLTCKAVFWFSLQPLECSYDIYVYVIMFCPSSAQGVCPFIQMSALKGLTNEVCYQANRRCTCMYYVLWDKETWKIDENPWYAWYDHMINQKEWMQANSDTYYFCLPRSIVKEDKLECMYTTRRHCGLVGKTLDFHARGCGFDSRSGQATQ